MKIANPASLIRDIQRGMASLLILSGLAAAQTTTSNQAMPDPGSWGRLSPPAQRVVSSSIGCDQGPYRAAAVPNGFQLRDPRSNLVAEFTRRRVIIQGGARANWVFQLDAYGRGEELRHAAATAPRASGNTVEYRRAGLVEWYENGPAGIEQGFTIPKPPADNASETLALAFSLAGDFDATLDPDGSGLTLRGHDGASTLHYGGLAAYDAKGRTLRSWLELRGRRLLVRVDGSGAQYPVVVDPYFQLATLTASDGAANDDFGWAVSVSADGGTVAVGANVAALVPAPAYVFRKPSTGWITAASYAAKLTVSDPFGNTTGLTPIGISSDGSTVAALEARLGPRGGELPVVYVFVKPSTGWKSKTQDAILQWAGSNVVGSVSVSADGSTVALGTGGGAPTVFSRPSTCWSGLTQFHVLLTPSNDANDGSFGSSVSVDGDGATVVVGAPGGLGERDRKRRVDCLERQRV